MKKIIENLLLKYLDKFFELLINALEKMLNADIDGDGDIGNQKPTKDETKQST
jgi:hypothetical protein